MKTTNRRASTIALIYVAIVVLAYWQAHVSTLRDGADGLNNLGLMILTVPWVVIITITATIIDIALSDALFGGLLVLGGAVNAGMFYRAEKRRTRPQSAAQRPPR